MPWRLWRVVPHKHDIAWIVRGDRLGRSYHIPGVQEQYVLGCTRCRRSIRHVPMPIARAAPKRRDLNQVV